MDDTSGMTTYMRSTLVRTPIVLVPSGSTSRANFSPSEFAKSVLAAVTARMIHAGLEMYFNNMSRICFSISLGWSPTGTFVKPGRSTRVRVRTFGEKILRLIGNGDMPAFLPVLASVSRTISSRIFEKSKNFSPGRCRNSPHSSAFAALSLVLSTPFGCAVMRSDYMR